MQKCRLNYALHGHASSSNSSIIPCLKKESLYWHVWHACRHEFFVRVKVWHVSIVSCHQLTRFKRFVSPFDTFQKVKWHEPDTKRNEPFWNVSTWHVPFPNVRPVISCEPRTITRKGDDPYICLSAHIYTGKLFSMRPRVSVGGFFNTEMSAEGSWEGIGFANVQRRLCAKRKSLQRTPTIVTTSKSIVDEIPFNTFTVLRHKWQSWWRFENYSQYWNRSNRLNTLVSDFWCSG